MLCERCYKNNSTISLTKIINSEKVEYHCCDECAKIVGNIDFETPFSQNSFLESLIDNVNKSPLKVNYIMMTACSGCGMTYNKYKELGALGCSECYKSFEEKLSKLITGKQGSELHSGKVPKGVTSNLSLLRELQKYKRDLKLTVEREQYEEAAAIRDKIKEIEKTVLGR